MDGVEDKADLCPKTPMTDLVDTTGCTIKDLISLHHFSLELGLTYAKSDTYNTTSPSLELDYNYKNTTIQFSSSYFDLQSDNLNEQGMDDSYLNLYHDWSLSNNFSLILGSGLILPTYNSSDNKIDYMTSLYGKYYFNNWSFSMGSGYIFTNDTNSKNRAFYSLNSAYQWSDKLYTSAGYSLSENIYEEEENFKSLFLYTSYNINQNWFTTLSLSKGLNSVSLDKNLGATLGYTW